MPSVPTPPLTGLTLATLDLKDSSLLILQEDVGETYNALCRSAATAVGAEACELALYDEDTGELIARRPSYSAPGRAVPRFRFKPTPASARVIQSGEAYLCNDPGSDPLYHPSVKDAGVRSLLTVPVRRGGRMLGLLYAVNKPGGFVHEDVLALSALAGAAAVTLQNVRLYADERDRRLLTESLHEVSRALVGGLSGNAGLATVLDQMWRVVRYEAAAVVILEEQRLRVAASRGGEEDVEIPLDSAGELRDVIESGWLAVLSHPATTLEALGMRGMGGRALAAPLVARQRVLGAFVVAFEPDSPPGLQDGQLVRAFADHAALFLDAAVLLRQERQARARAAAVARITRIVVTRHEPESLLQSVAPEMLGLSDADRAIIYLKHEKNPVLRAVADAGILPHEGARARELRIDLSAGPLAPLLDSPRPMLFQRDATPPPRSITAFPETRSLLVLPIVSHDLLLGALFLAWLGSPRALDAGMIDFLHDLWQQVAVGVENARLFTALSQLASTDDLTRLANRRRFIETLRLEVTRSRRSSASLALVMVDVDHLKKINDSYGHPAGDAAIRHIADTLRRGRRETDLVARLGGEEFVLLLPETDLAGAVQAAERIRQELAVTSVSGVGTVTVSMGIATTAEDGADEQELVRRADERLYAAKAAGRNQICHGRPPTEEWPLPNGPG